MERQVEYNELLSNSQFGHEERIQELVILSAMSSLVEWKQSLALIHL